MPFNGAGTYSPPGADFPAVAGTIIQATKFNNVVNDIATALSTAITKDGQTTVTANIPFSGFYATNVGVKLIAGTVGAPALAWNSEPSSGWYRVAANNYALAIAGVKAWDISTTGNLTITNAAPELSLDGNAVGTSMVRHRTNSTLRWLAGVPSGSTDYRWNNGVSDVLGVTALGVLSLTKATGGDAITFTNAVAGNKTGFLYTDATYVGFGGTATLGGDNLYFDVTNHTFGLQVNNALKFSLSATGGFVFASAGRHGIGIAADNRCGLLIGGSPTTIGTAVDIGTGFEQTVAGQVNNNAYGVAFSGGSSAITLNKAGSGTHADFACVYIGPPNIGAGGAALTNATTLKIGAAPTVGTSQKALWCLGAAQFDGGTVITTSAVGTNTTAAASTAFVSAFHQQITASLGADVNLGNSGNYVAGPAVAQGASGTWFVVGTVGISFATNNSNTDVKLWDGTTVIDAVRISNATNNNGSVTLMGFITSPAGNLRMDVKDASATNTNKIVFNATGTSKDSTITAFKLAN